MLVGYARVSSKGQDTKLQLDALQAAGCERVFEETASGAKKDRPKLAELLAFVREGDTVVVWKLDRLARSLGQLVTLIDDLRGRNIGFKVLTGAPIDTTTKEGVLVFSIFAGLAEFERELIKERTRTGLEAARAEGRFGGRPLKLDEARIAELKGRLAEGQPWRSIAKTMGVALSTIGRYAAGMNDEAIERRKAVGPTNGRKHRKADREGPA